MRRKTTSFLWSNNRLNQAISATSILIVVVITLMTILYNIPSGKVRDRLIFVDSIMNPVFEQKWTLFAPEPPQVDIGILGGYKSDKRKIEFVNLTSPELTQNRGKLVPRKSNREIDSLVTEFTGQVERVLETADIDSIPPYFFAVSDQELEQALAKVDKTHPEIIDDYNFSLEKLTLAVLDRLGGNDLKRECQQHAGEVTLKIVGVEVPGFGDVTGTPTVQTVKTIKCGENVNAAF